jgi:hypothetical protein
MTSPFSFRFILVLLLSLTALETSMASSRYGKLDSSSEEEDEGNKTPLRRTGFSDVDTGKLSAPSVSKPKGVSDPDLLDISSETEKSTPATPKRRPDTPYGRKPITYAGNTGAGGASSGGDESKQ